MTKEEIEKLPKEKFADIWCYCTNCKLYHEHKEVLGVELKYGGRAKHKTMIAYQWCDHYKSEMKGAGIYLCKFFDPAITREEYNKLKEKQK